MFCGSRFAFIVFKNSIFEFCGITNIEEIFCGIMENINIEEGHKLV